MKLDKDKRKRMLDLRLAGTPESLHEYDILAERYGLNAPGPCIDEEVWDRDLPLYQDYTYERHWIPTLDKSLSTLWHGLVNAQGKVSGPMKIYCANSLEVLKATHERVRRAEFNLVTLYPGVPPSPDRRETKQTIVAAWSLDDGIAYRLVNTGVRCLYWYDIVALAHGYQLRFSTSKKLEAPCESKPLLQGGNSLELPFQGGNTYSIDFRRADLALGIHDYTIVKNAQIWPQP